MISSGTVIIDDYDTYSHTGLTYIFSNPERVLTCHSPDDVPNLLHELDNAMASGKWAAGYLGYEAGLALDKPITPLHSSNVPLAWFGVYDEPVVADYASVDFGEMSAAECVSNVRLNIDETEYTDCINRIKDYIAAGDVYQVNYTCKLLFEHDGPALGIFARLREAHPVGYSTYIDTGDFQVISLSPELFLRRTGSHILTRPMKGTCRRGRWYEEDAEHAADLSADTKNRAENLMIVDLMRNDIGRISEFGSVETSRMFHVERFRTLFQMTTDVEGTLRPGVTSADILTATFPPGSVTGAPKIRALEIINELENEPRGVYCGGIGFFKPNGDCLLNVAIRTIVQFGNRCEMGVGSGVVADSEPGMEYRETLLKGSFLKLEPQDFGLLETIRYEPEMGFMFLDKHIERMRKSGEYFGWLFREQAVRNRLSAAADEMNGIPNAFRVRILASKDGGVEVEWSQSDAVPDMPVKLVVSEVRTDPQDTFLYHKTTNRNMYNEGLKAARDQGYFDALYLNTRGEITECSICNFVIELDGKLYTPPLECGLLPGIWRARLLAEGCVRERVLTVKDLGNATRVIIGNSVRGAIEVGSVETTDGETILRGTDKWQK